VNVKLFEVRDSMTFIVCIGIELHREPLSDKRDDRLIWRAGYAPERYVLFGRLDRPDEGMPYDPNMWPSHIRTLSVAHRHAIEHWDELKSGDLIDVEFILGERSTPKESELR
jgi:hypothetical protein